MPFLNPENVVKQLPLEEGLNVADLGAGVGHFSIPVAKRIGTGKVYAVEVNKELIGSIKNAATKDGLTNVEIIWGDIERPGGTKLADGSVGLVILANVIFQAENKEGVVIEAKRILKPRGYVLAVDWRESFGGLGPAPGDVISEEAGKKMFLNSGFSLYNEIDADAYHWGFLFQKL